MFFRLNGIRPGGDFEIADYSIQEESQLNDDPRLLKVTLAREITDYIIDVTYTTDGEEVFNTLCMASLTANSDDDNDGVDGAGVIDIADASPFDRTNNAPNPDTTAIGEQTTTLAAVNEITGQYYSRSAVIRSLLRDEGFIYLEGVRGNEDIEVTFPNSQAPVMSWQTYFGINANADTQIFRAEEGQECADVLRTARVNNLDEVKINAFDNCIEVTDFATEPVTPRGRQQYFWADVRNGVLVASDYPVYDLKIVPEINFLGQPSYIFSEADAETTNTVFISAYVGDEGDDITYTVV